MVRTADIVADSLRAAHLSAVDRCVTKNCVADVQKGVKAFFPMRVFKQKSRRKAAFLLL